MRKLIVVVVLVGLVPSVAADPAARRAAEHLANAASTEHDDAKFVACGQAFLEIYNKDPQASDNDEVLYNAAVCFELGKSVSAELTTYALLLKYFPRSKLAAKALWVSATAYAGIAYYDRAADALEQYAVKYAGEKDAPDALADALRYRTALGDTAKRLEDTRRFISTYGRTRSEQAAAAEYALLSVYDNSSADALLLMREYMKQFGKVIRGEQAVIAHAKLGEMLWAESCPVPLVDGLCIATVRDRQQVQRCSSEAIPLAVVKRSALHAEAIAEYKQALALYDRSLGPQATHAAAMASIALADDDLERTLGASLPSDLDFDPDHAAAREHSVKRFGTWIAAQTAASQQLASRYAAVLQIKDAESSIAAAARLAQTAQAFARTVLTAEIPKSIRTGRFAKEKIDAYCDNLREVTAPLIAHAIEAFDVCRIKAIELGTSDTWSNVCWREGHRLAADKFPNSHELHAVPALGPLPLSLETATR